jgi:hypothetical protein
MKANFSQYTEIVPVEPQVISTAGFNWNYDKMKEFITAVTEKYDGLIVTDENLADMKKAKAELVSTRTKLTKFGKEVKAELKKPYDTFSKQITELEDIVRSREAGLDEQLNKYEEKRRSDVISKIQAAYSKKAEELGLPYEKYHLIVEEKWLNKTAKWADVEEGITKEVSEQVKALHESEMAEKLEAAQRESAMLYCQLASLKAGLKTPVTIKDISLTGDTKSDWAAIDKAVLERKSIEEKAVEKKEPEAKKPVEAKEAKDEVSSSHDVAPAEPASDMPSKREYLFRVYGTEDTRKKVAEWLESNCIFFREEDVK